MSERALPLGNILAVDFSQGIAGPYCGLLMAEHGARVLKIEPPAGDWIRGLGAAAGGMSVNARYYNRGKESLVLDLKTPAGKAAAETLVSRADLVIESGRPGVMARLGLDFEAARRLNGSVIYVSVSGFGQTGPRASDPLTDTPAQAFSGMMSLNRGRDGAPHKIDTTIIDAITGLYAFQAASMALWPGNGPREAAHLDISLMQAAAAVLGPKVMEHSVLGRPAGKLNAPAGSYQASDGWLAVTLVREADFAKLSEAMALDGLASDPRFGSFDARADNIVPLTAALDAAFAKASVATWLERFREAGLVASRIHDFGDWLKDPQVVETGAAPFDGAGAATPRTPGRDAWNSSPPGQGADTERVLVEFGIATGGGEGGDDG